MDLFLSGVVLTLSVPLLIPIVIALRFTAEREVFYLQDRMGYLNRKFKIWKFATMLRNSPNMLTGSLTVRNDPRVTVVGQFLRKTKINELPQVVNVILGDMSIVGPRPQMEQDFMAFPPEIRKTIYDVKPGITGIGSIIFRDEERLFSSTHLDPHLFYKFYIAPYKGELELWYQKNASLLTDLLIIILTGWYIFFPQSNLVFRVFRDLPPAPQELMQAPGELVEFVNFEQ